MISSYIIWIFGKHNVNNYPNNLLIGKKWTYFKMNIFPIDFNQMLIMLAWFIVIKIL